MGCEKNVASAATEVYQQADTPVLVATGEACASHGAKSKRSAHTKHHGKSAPAKSTARSNNSKASFGNTPTLVAHGGRSSMMNCPLAVNSSAVLSKFGSDKIDGNLAAVHVQEPFAESLEQVAAFTRPLRLPNRGHTYLQCCVFLI